jgi:hypothetical protein
MGEMDDGTRGRYRVFLVSVVLLREDYRGWGKWTMGRAAVIVYFWYPWHSLVRTTAEGEMDDGTCGCYRAFLVSAVLLREDYRGWGKWTMGRAAVIVYFWYPRYSLVGSTADGGNGRWDARPLSCISGIRGTRL